MHKSVFSKGILFLSGLVGLASAQFKYWDVDSAHFAPATLSATGFYSNINTKTVVSNAHVFEVNSALWSDGSHKKRWVLLKANTKIVFNERSDYWTYPDSAVFVKNFAIDTIPGDTTSRRLWETRFIILKKKALDPNNPTKKSDQWYGFSYRWRKDQTNADLVADTGLKDAIGWYPAGKGTKRAFKKWIYPDRAKCLDCHRTESSDTLHGRSVLGFFTAQLNRPSPTNPAINQIEDLFNKGVLTGTKPTNYTASPRWYGIDEPLSATVTLEKKARAYIAANCSGCHGDRGTLLGATFGVDLNYDYHLGTPHMEYEYRSVGWTYGLDTSVPPVSFNEDSLRYMGVYLVTPGYPQKSVIVFRQKSRNRVAIDDPDSLVRLTAYDPDRNQMPPLASFESNDPAIKVISDWIASLPQKGAPLRIRGNHTRSALLTPTIRGGNVILPLGLIHLADKGVNILGIDGKSRELTRIGHGIYALPSGMPKGVYIIKVGAKSFTRYLF